jgi:Peptidase family S49
MRNIAAWQFDPHAAAPRCMLAAAAGKYKSAGDQLLRRDMSEAQAEQLSALLDDIYAGFTQVVASARGKSEQEVRCFRLSCITLCACDHSRSAGMAGLSCGGMSGTTWKLVHRDCVQSGTATRANLHL